jgi:radical SAM superfamily enzyme YgiQ (UPF0313 family)
MPKKSTGIKITEIYMKILLIHPPFSLTVAGRDEWDKVIPRIHPLGIGYLASYLLKHGHDVKIVDAHLEKLELIDILDRINSYGPDLIGISTTTPTFKITIKIAQEIKKNAPGLKIFIGGAHITATPETAMVSKCFDYGIVGEGEKTFLELVQYLENPSNKNIFDIAGLALRKNGKVFNTPIRGYIENLDELPMPARHLMIALKETQAVPASVYKLPSGNLITSRGCPSQCSFCDRAIFGMKFRARNAKSVVDEVEILINEYGARDIKFFDDTFTVSKQRVYEIIDEMKRRKIKIPWSCLTKVKSINKELLKAMKEAGCWQILFGLESGDDRMLKLLKKGNTVEDNRKAVTMAAELGINTRGDFIVGTPGETKESLMNTLNFALSIPLDYAHFNKFVPLPGTEIYRELLNKGYDFDEKMLEGSCVDMFDIEFVPEGLDRAFYENFLIESHKKFYFRPKYLIKKIFSIKTFDQFKVQMDGFRALIKI